LHQRATNRKTQSVNVVPSRHSEGHFANTAVCCGPTTDSSVFLDIQILQQVPAILPTGSFLSYGYDSNLGRAWRHSRKDTRRWLIFFHAFGDVFSSRRYCRPTSQWCLICTPL